MLRKPAHSIFMVTLLGFLSVTHARAAQIAAPVEQTPAQVAAAQVISAQAAATQAAAQANAAQVAARQAALKVAATPAGPLKVAAQAAADEANAQATAALTAARQAAAQVVAARQVAAVQAAADRQAAAAQALAARQAAAAQALAARQAAASQAIAAKTARATGTTPQSLATTMGFVPAPAAATPAKPAPAAGATPAGKTTGAGSGAGTGTGGSATPSWESLVSTILTNGNANSASATGKAGAGAKGAGSADAADPAAAHGGPSAAHAENVLPAAATAPGRAPLNPSILSSGLGMAQSGNMILTVFGCMREGLQVACDTELSNQNKSETLVQSSSAWTDMLLIDDRGDRHERFMGFFLNIDGEKRTDMDIPYGQSARFILVFNDVPAKVSSVSLHSSTGGLNVTNITVSDPNSAPEATTASNPAPTQAPAPAAGKNKPGKNGGAGSSPQL